MKPIDLVELINKNITNVKLETYFEPNKGFYIYTGVFELQIGLDFVSTYFWTNVYPSVEEQFLSTITRHSLPTPPSRYFGFGSVMKKSDINSFLSYLKKQFLQRPELSRYIIFETTGEFAGSFTVKTEEMDVKTMYEVVRIIASAANPIVNTLTSSPPWKGRGFPSRGLIVPTIGSGLHPSFGGQTRGSETPSCLALEYLPQRGLSLPSSSPLKEGRDDGCSSHSPIKPSIELGRSVVSITKIFLAKKYLKLSIRGLSIPAPRRGEAFRPLNPHFL